MSEQEFTGQHVEVTIGKAKAVAAAVLGFVGPGVAVLIPQVAPGGDGISGRELIWAGLLCLGFGAAGGGLVYATENKATSRVVDDRTNGDQL